MNEISNYLYLRMELQYSDFHVESLQSQGSDELILQDAKARNSQMRNELNNLLIELNRTDADKADQIRVGYIAYINAVLEKFAFISEHPGQFPDLSQSMVIPGYLLGMILNEFRHILTTGGFTPNPIFYRSNREWPSKYFEDLLKQTKLELMDSNFYSLIDAVNWYDRITDRISVQLSVLHKLRLI